MMKMNTPVFEMCYMYRSFLENGVLIRYILHTSGQIQRTRIWSEDGKRKSESFIVAVDGDEENFDMICLAAELRRKDSENKNHHEGQSDEDVSSH